MANKMIGVNSDLVQQLFQNPDRLREVLEVLCQAAMSQEVSGHLGAESHERSDERRGLRNGHKPRTLRTRVGELTLAVPQVRDCDRGPYHPSLFAKWERSERALLVACGEMYFQGVSTRNVQHVLSTMCEGIEISAMTVSRVAAEIDEKLAVFRERRLDGHAYPYVKVDAGQAYACPALREGACRGQSHQPGGAGGDGFYARGQARNSRLAGRGF